PRKTNSEARMAGRAPRPRPTATTASTYSSTRAWLVIQGSRARARREARDTDTTATRYPGARAAQPPIQRGTRCIAVAQSCLSDKAIFRGRLSVVAEWRAPADPPVSGRDLSAVAQPTGHRRNAGPRPGPGCPGRWRAR